MKFTILTLLAVILAAAAAFGKESLYTTTSVGDNTTTKPIKPVRPPKPSRRGLRRLPAAAVEMESQTGTLNAKGDQSGKKAAAKPDATKKRTRCGKCIAPTPGITAYGTDQTRPADPRSQTGSLGRDKSARATKKKAGKYPRSGTAGSGVTTVGFYAQDHRPRPGIPTWPRPKPGKPKPKMCIFVRMDMSTAASSDRRSMISKPVWVTKPILFSRNGSTSGIGEKAPA